MNNINYLVYESLSDHLKKHWKKYALGLGGAALASGHLYQKRKENQRQLRNKILLGTGGLVTGTGLGILGHKAFSSKYVTNNITNNITHNHNNNSDNDDFSFLNTGKKIIKDTIHKHGKDLLNAGIDHIFNWVNSKK